MKKEESYLVYLNQNQVSDFQQRYGKLGTPGQNQKLIKIDQNNFTPGDGYSTDLKDQRKSLNGLSAKHVDFNDLSEHIPMERNRGSTFVQNDTLLPISPPKINVR